MCLPSIQSAGYAHRHWTDDALCENTMRTRKISTTEDAEDTEVFFSSRTVPRVLRSSAVES
jgi:hypothetical protein